LRLTVIFSGTTPNVRSRGFTLIELTVAIGIVLLLAALGLPSLNAAREQPAGAAVAFTELLDTTRAIAAGNDGTGSGALLVVQGDDRHSVLTVLTNRPLPGYDLPRMTPHLTPITLALPITLDGGATHAFSLAVAPSGEFDVIRTALSPGAAEIATAPGCGEAGARAISVTFGTPPRTSLMQIACANAS
jgi:prepilin-type N-terminal cleavage/methylation domain-containing protein